MIQERNDQSQFYMFTPAMAPNSGPERLIVSVSYVSHNNLQTHLSDKCRPPNSTCAAARQIDRYRPRQVDLFQRRVECSGPARCDWLGSESLRCVGVM